MGSKQRAAHATQERHSSISSTAGEARAGAAGLGRFKPASSFALTGLGLLKKTLTQGGAALALGYILAAFQAEERPTRRSGATGLDSRLRYAGMTKTPDAEVGRCRLDSRLRHAGMTEKNAASSRREEERRQAAALQIISAKAKKFTA